MAASETVRRAEPIASKTVRRAERFACSHPHQLESISHLLRQY